MKRTKCERCNKPLSRWGKRFCSQSCASSTNNRVRKLPKRREARFCLVCGKELNKGKKYCSLICQHQNTTARTNAAKIKAGTAGPAVLKRFLRDTAGNYCALCGLPALWHGKPLVLILDHIDGDSTNNFVENLRLVCPNCDSQLPTFKNRNKGRGRHSRRERYRSGKSY